MGYENLKGKRCIVLARCSTMGQADTSIDDQLRAAEVFIAEQQMVKVDEMVLKGVSGSIAKNMDVAIDEIVRRKQNGQALDAVVVYDPSRFSRGGPDHAASLRHKLVNVGIELVTVMNYQPPSDASDIINCVGSMSARQHAKSIASGVARGSQSAMEQGRKGHCSVTPYALDKLFLKPDGQPLHIIRSLSDGTQQRLSPDAEKVLDTYGRNDKTGVPRHYRKQKDEYPQLIPGEASRIGHIHQIYRWYFLDGWGYWSIAAELNKLGIPSATGKAWKTAVIKTLLDNPVYTGRGIANRQSAGLYFQRSPGKPKEIKPGLLNSSGRPAGQLRPKEEWLEIVYPKLIDYLPDDVRAKAAAHHQKILDGRAAGYDRQPRDKHTQSSFILKGLLKEAGGLAMTGTPKGKNNQYRYYRVGNAYAAPGGPKHLRKMVRADEIEGFVLEQVRQFLLSIPDLRGEILAEIKASLRERSKAAGNRGAKEQELEQSRRRMLQMAEQLGGLNDPAINDQIARAKAQFLQLKSELEALGSFTPPSDGELQTMLDRITADLASTANLLRDLPVPVLRELLAAMVQELTIDLSTMQLRCVLSLPPWAKVASIAGQATESMGVGLGPVYKGLADAHPRFGQVFKSAWTIPKGRQTRAAAGSASGGGGGSTCSRRPQPVCPPGLQPPAYRAARANDEPDRYAP